MMNLSEIGASAAGLGNQMQAGIPLDQALTRLVQMQPSYADFWAHSVVSVQSGRLLSDCLSEVWPATLVGVVQAGEKSGKLENIFGRIEETIELQQELRSQVLKLAYPLGMGVAGVAVFIGFMVFVLPTLGKSLDTGSTSLIFKVSSWMAEFANENWMVVLTGMVAGVIALVSWLRTPEAQDSIMETLLTVPVVKDALRDLYFGLWANYMAMVAAAGIPTNQALEMTAVVLPAGMRDSVLVFERDLTVNHRSMSEAVDLPALAADDPRVAWWPMYICNAFIIAEQTGTIDKELLRVAPPLIKEGRKTLDAVIATANVAALALAATFIISPLAAYYVEIFSAIKQAGR